MFPEGGGRDKGNRVRSARQVPVGLMRGSLRLWRQLTYDRLAPEIRKKLFPGVE